MEFPRGNSAAMNYSPCYIWWRHTWMVRSVLATGFWFFLLSLAKSHRVFIFPAWLGEVIFPSRNLTPVFPFSGVVDFVVLRVIGLLHWFRNHEVSLLIPSTLLIITRFEYTVVILEPWYVTYGYMKSSRLVWVNFQLINKDSRKSLNLRFGN